MNKRKRLVIPVLLGMICMCLFPDTGYAAENSGQSMTLILEVPEKPDTQIEAPAEVKTLAEITLPKDWTWKDATIQVQPGRTITVTAVHKDGYEMEIEVTGKLAIFTTGTDSEYTIGSSGSVSIHCNGVLDALQSVEMDGKTVDPANYDKKDGSTIVTFKKSYLDTLSVGTHTVTLDYEAGSIDSKVEIKKASTTEPTNGTTGTNTTGTNTTTTSAKTGDDTNVAGMAVLAVLSLGVCILLLAKRKKTT